MCDIGVNPNALDATGITVLQKAVSLRLESMFDLPRRDVSINVIQVLLDHAAHCNVAIKTHYGFETLFREILCHEDLEVLEMFLIAGVNTDCISYVDNVGADSAMEFACMNGRPATIELLKKHGCTRLADDMLDAQIVNEDIDIDALSSICSDRQTPSDTRI